jgi:hypothetical protein
MKATLQTLQAQTLKANETFVLRNHNGTMLAASLDVFAIKEEQETYRMVTGNDTHMTIEMDPVDYYQQDALCSRELD